MAGARKAALANAALTGQPHVQVPVPDDSFEDMDVGSDVDMGAPPSPAVAQGQAPMDTDAPGGSGTGGGRHA